MQAENLSNNAIMYSSDGVNWIASTQSILSSCNAIAWNGSIWLAGDTAIMYSYNGINWTASTQTVITACNKIAWNGSIWLAGGGGDNTVAYSVDGINWTGSASANSIFVYGGQCASVAWNGTMWVAGGYIGDAVFEGYISGTSLTVTALEYGTLAVGRVINCNLGSFVQGTTITALGSGSGGEGTYTVSAPQTVGNAGETVSMTIPSLGRIAYSYDGINWISASPTTVGNNLENCTTVAWNGSIWLAGGVPKAVGQAILKSTNGVTWTTAIQTQITTGVASLAWNGTTWIAGGTNAGVGKLAKSTDGSTWTAISYSGFTIIATALAARRPLPFVGAGNSTPGFYYRASGPTGPTGGVTGPAGPWLGLTANIVPLLDNIYDLGATGYQIKDIYFSGNLYQDGTVFSGGGGGGVAGTDGQFTYNNAGASAGSDRFVYRATGPTGPTGAPTGPIGQPTIQVGAHLVPIIDNVYDLGATGLRFRDLHVGGSTIYLGDSVTLSASAGNFNVNSSPLVSSSEVPNTGSGGVGYSESFAQVGAQLTTNMRNTNPGNIGMSADGKYISYIASDAFNNSSIYVSSDYGATFTAKGTARPYVCIAVSSTGKYQAAAANSNGLYFSTDFGNTWENVGISSESNWGGIKISTDGRIVLAWPQQGTGGYITRDEIPTSGSVWNSVNLVGNLIDQNTVNVYMSDSGDRVLVLTLDGANSNYKVQGFKVTRNGSLTALTVSGTYITSIFNSQILPSVALSRDGTRFGIYGRDVDAGNDNLIKTNQYTWDLTNTGTITPVVELSVIKDSVSTWTVYFPTVMSSDGTIQLVGTGGNTDKGLYISYNSGVTWTYIVDYNGNLDEKWYYILMSSNGAYINIINNYTTSDLWQSYSANPTVSVSALVYTPTTPGDWPTALRPISVGAALDTIAKYLQANQTLDDWTDLT